MKRTKPAGIFPGDQSTKKNTAAVAKAPIIEDPNMRSTRKDDNEKRVCSGGDKWGEWYRR